MSTRDCVITMLICASLGLEISMSKPERVQILQIKVENSSSENKKNDFTSIALKTSQHIVLVSLSSFIRIVHQKIEKVNNGPKSLKILPYLGNRCSQSSASNCLPVIAPLPSLEYHIIIGKDQSNLKDNGIQTFVFVSKNSKMLTIRGYT